MKARRCLHGSDNRSVLTWVIICACAVLTLSAAAYGEEPQQPAKPPIPEYANHLLDGLKKKQSDNYERISEEMRELDKQTVGVNDAQTGVKQDAQTGVAQDAQTGVKQDGPPDQNQATRVNSKQDFRDPLDVMGDDVEVTMRQDELRGPGRWFFNTRIGQRLARFETGDIRKRPMMYWRRFADHPVGPIGTFLLFSFFNIVISLGFRKRVNVASQCVRKSFWKSLFAGGFFVILVGTGARLCFDSIIFTPCALLLLGIAEFLTLCGLAVSSRTLGLALLTKLGYMQASQLSGEPPEGSVDLAAKRKARLQYLVPVLVGTVLITMVVLIPGFGPLPRLGTRFAMWFAVLGLGALVRTKLGRNALS